MGRRQLIARPEPGRMAPILVLAVLGGLIGFGIYDSWAHYRPVYSLAHDAALKAPASYRAQLNASEAFINQRRWALALAYAQRAIAIHPERASGWINASSAAGGLQAWALSYRYLEKALAIHPARPLAENMIYVCRVLGKTEEAEQWEAVLIKLPEKLILKEPTQ